VSLPTLRILALLCACVAIIWAVRRREALNAAFDAYLFEPTPPQNLACVRIALFAGLTWAALHTEAVWWAAQPEGMRRMLPGWRWLRDILPINATIASYAQYALIGASVLAMLGLNTRFTAPLAAVIGVYLLGIPSFFGKVVHVDHALMLMVLVIAASPCADAFSLDRWLDRRGTPPPGPAAAYTLPMRLCWLLLGTIYLFPGLWKVWGNGDLWLNGQRLLFELNDEWSHRKGFVPPLRIDHYPWLLALLGTSTLLFEVGFIFAVLRPRTRVIAALAACAFHTGVRLFLGIQFYAWLPLVMLIDLPWFSASAGSADSGRSTRPAAVVGCALLFGQVCVGLIAIDTWPLALHPLFDERFVLGAVTHGTRIRYEPQSGRERDVLYVLTKNGGGADSFRRTLLSFDRDVSSHREHAGKGRAIVSMLRQNDIEIDPGDGLAIYDSSWDTLPLLERNNYKEKVVRRYRVTEDGDLERASR
jgi:hypothetical protein